MGAECDDELDVSPVKGESKAWHWFKITELLSILLVYKNQ